MENIRYGRKRRGLKRELNMKIDSWLESIEDLKVRDAASKDVIVTGGSICSMLMGERVNDYDLYFRTKETTQLVAEYYVKSYNKNNKVIVADGVESYIPVVINEDIANIKGGVENRIVIFMKSAGVCGENQDKYYYFENMPKYYYFENMPSSAVDKFVESLTVDSDDAVDDYRVIFMSQNAITLSNKIQLVIRFYGEPDEIHDNYDFVHATCYFDYHNDILEFPADAMEAMLSRTLIYKGSLYPVASIFRAKKFIERGWRITAGQLLKIMWQISEIDLSDYEVLREQLTGVDAAYMYELINALKGVDQTKITSTYVSSIIDKIFD